MKSIYYLCVAGIIWISASCNTSGSSDSDQANEAAVKALNPLESTKSIFQNLVSKYDSVSVEDSDSTFTYFVIPKSEDYDPEKELYGAFSIDKKSIKLGDLNGDGLDDVVVQYSYTPHLENNSLIYYKVLLQENGDLKEAGEIFGGGRCEGPILTAESIKKGIINFNGLEYDNGDPCCCPSIKKTHSYKLEGSKIVELEKK